ncbi:hypothetical protein D3C81_2101900 [compost metagenome]
MKPIGIARFGPMLQHILEWSKSVAGMIKYRIQHNANPSSVAFLHHRSEGLLIAKLRVDF